jgi:hypothetical protein
MVQQNKDALEGLNQKERTCHEKGCQGERGTHRNGIDGAAVNGQSDPTYDSEVQLSPFIYYSLFLTSGIEYTIETKNLTSGGDTVLHVLYNNGLSFQQIASNDDLTGLASKVVFSAPTTGFYKVWVRAFSNSSGGKADVVVNGLTELTQAPFGGNTHYMAWSYGEQFRVATTRFTGSADSMVFLLVSNEGFLQMDDDSGPSLSAFAQAASSESGPSRVVYGVHPGATSASYGRLFVQYPPGLTLSPDADGDGLTDVLESLIGTSPSNADSDNDSIPDAIETIGGGDAWQWTFSRSSTAPFGNNPLRRNAFVEIDYMTDSTTPSNNRQPYSNLPMDASSIFSTDGDSDLTLTVDGSVPWHRNIGLDGCAAAVPDCVDFRTLKTSAFSTYLPERRPYFHYAVFAERHSNGCSSGMAELLGNDLVITLGCGLFTWAEQLGTFAHELGHNLNLTHNGNDDASRNYSVIHNSVMNYRYQFSGTSPIGRHTYSFGTAGCAPCTTSPKQACITLNSANLCDRFPFCDCDESEWSYAINYDMTEGGDLNDGVAYSSPSGTLPTVARPLNLDRPGQLAARFDKDPTRVVSASELATAVSAELKKFERASSGSAAIAAREAQVKLEQADVTHDVLARETNALKPNLARRQASAAKRAALLRAKGLVEGRDFQVSSDKSAIFMH